MSKNIFEQAKLFYSMGKTIPMTEERKIKIEKLTKTLQNSPYFSQNQKDMMSDVIPYFNNSLIEEINNTLMRESLRNIK